MFSNFSQRKVEVDMTTLEEIKTVLIGKTIRHVGTRNECGFITGIRLSDPITTSGTRIIVTFIYRTGLFSSIYAHDFNMNFEYHSGNKWKKMPGRYYYITNIAGNTMYYRFGYDEI